MNRWKKVGLVCLGYLLAIVAGGVAGYLYDRKMSAMPYDTSGGMYAAGEGLSALAAFLVVAMAPTLLALWFLRGNSRLWQAIAFASLAFAGVGLIAVLMPLGIPETNNHPALIVLELVRLGQLLGVPLWTAAFVLFAILAPSPPARRILRTAVGLELIIALCAAIHWFVPRPPI